MLRFPYALRKLLNLGPFGLRAMGSRSIIYRPRKIENPGSISVGKSTVIREHSWIAAIRVHAGRVFEPKIVIGDGVYIGRYFCAMSIDQIYVGDGCVLSEHVFVTDLSHGLDPIVGPIMSQALISRGPVFIGQQSFIGYRACLMEGVKLGSHSVVGANSVVTHSFPEYSMIAGCPARLIKTYCTRRREWIRTKEGCR